MREDWFAIGMSCLSMGLNGFTLWRVYRARQKYERLDRPPPKQAPKLHPDGVPIGLRPGDPIPRENIGAIWDFVRRATDDDQGGA